MEDGYEKGKLQILRLFLFQIQRMSIVKKILIADDEPDILEIIKFNLQLHNHDVQTAKDGDQAIDIAKKFRPDLIILDIMMPKKNGI